MRLEIQMIGETISLVEDNVFTGVTFSEEERAHLQRNGNKIVWKELATILESGTGTRWTILRDFRRKRKEAESRCVYCADGIGTTYDHIPPLAFFAEPYPENLITVPCCEACRVKDAADDAFNKSLITSLLTTETHPSVLTQIAENNLRGYEHDRSLAIRLHKLVKNTPLGPAFDMDNPPLNRFLERVTRAVLFDGLKMPFFAAEFKWLLQKTALGIYDHPPADCIVKKRGDTFTYLIPPREIIATESGAIFQFYRGFFVIGILHRT